MDKYDETRTVIEHMAKVKMTMNAHKGNIEDLEDAKIIELLKGEVDEIDDATSMMHIIEESADAYNFLLALTHKKIQAYRGRK